MPIPSSGARPYRAGQRRASRSRPRRPGPVAALGSRRIAAQRVTRCILGPGMPHASEPVYLALPMGTAHGWGVCGRYITRELARLAPVSLITDRLEARLVGDELELAALRALLAPTELQAGGHGLLVVQRDPASARARERAHRRAGRRSHDLPPGRGRARVLRRPLRGVL